MGFKLGLPQPISTADSPTFVGLTITGLTAGRVPYVGASDELADTANLAWSNSLQKLTIGSASLTNPPDETSFFISKDYTSQTNDNMTEQIRSYLQSVGSGDVQAGRIAISAWVKDHPTNTVNRTITGAANDGTGEIRITSNSHGFVNGDLISIYGVTGTTEANGTAWVVKDATTNTFDLTGSTFTNAYVSGGTATNRSQIVGFRSVVQPVLSRDFSSNIGDDCNNYTAVNAGPGKATDCFWFTDELSPALSNAYRTIISGDSGADYLIRWTGKAYIAGIDLASATLDTSSIPMFLLGAGHNFQLDTATGTKFGTATTQKIGFFNATPIVQPSSTTDLRAALINLGLYATGGASPLDLNGGTLTAARAVLSTGTITSSTPAIAMTQTWNSGGTAFTGFSFTVTKTAADATSRYFDILDGTASRLYLDDNGTLGHTAKNGTSSNLILAAHANNLTANTVITTMTGEVSAGTVATPLRSQLGQVALRNAGFGWLAVDDATTATRGSAHRAAMDWVVAEDWTSSAQGMYLRFRTTPDGTTTTNINSMYGVTRALNDGAAQDILSCTVASGSMSGGIIRYLIEATDGTDYQAETGFAVWTAVNKAGTVTAAITEVNSQQSLSGGTLTTAWAISTANPAVISVNANTSLAPSAGHPRITYSVDNFARQAIALA